MRQCSIRSGSISPARTSRRPASRPAKDFLAAIGRAQRFDCIVSDVRMPGMSGLELVHHLKAQDVGVPIILITGHGDVDMAVAAIKVGAFDFIEKPFDEARLLASIRNAVEKGRQRETDASEVEKLQSRFNTLSTRQRQVMELAVSGLSNKEIRLAAQYQPEDRRESSRLGDGAHRRAQHRRIGTHRDEGPGQALMLAPGPRRRSAIRPAGLIGPCACGWIAPDAGP